MKYNTKNVFILFFILFANISLATVLEPTLKYKIKDVGSISIPASLEIISGKYKKMDDSLQLETRNNFDYELYDSRIVFQQKGLNDFRAQSFQTYARIIIETYIGKTGDYDKLTTTIKLTPQQVLLLSSQTKAQLVSDFAKQNKVRIKLINWEGLQQVVINNKPAIKTSYIRQVNDNPPAMVTIYDFHNNDRMHEVIISYRTTDEAIWKQPLEQAIQTFQISNIK